MPSTYVQRTDLAQRARSTSPEDNAPRHSTFSKVPVLGLSYIFGVLVTSIGAAVILITSNEQPTATWPAWPTAKSAVSPTVLISIMVTLSNAFLALALTEAFTIRWWLLARKPLSVADLHYNWAQYESIYEGTWRAAILGRRPNRIAIAKLLVMLAAIQGPLAQRASSTVLTLVPRIAEELRVKLPSTFLPPGFTGFKTSQTPVFYTEEFLPAVRGFDNRSPMGIEYTGCNEANKTTECRLFYAVAPGWDITCDKDGISGEVGPLGANATEIFYTKLDYDTTGSTPVIKVEVAYPLNGTMVDVSSQSMEDDGLDGVERNSRKKTDIACQGTLQKTSCTLHPATVKYPLLTLRNGTVELQDVEISFPDMLNNTVQLHYEQEGETAEGFMRTTIGGIYLAGVLRYNSSVQVGRAQMVDKPPLYVKTSGRLGTEYLTSTHDIFGYCNMTWDDPLPDILNGMQELLFRAALESSTSKDWQTPSAGEVAIYTVYRSEYPFLAAALVVPVIAALSILSMMWGWWELEKWFTLSPVEIGKALHAPLLKEARGDFEVEKMLKHAGNVDVVYGGTDVGFVQHTGKEMTPSPRGRADSQ